MLEPSLNSQPAPPLVARSALPVVHAVTTDEIIARDDFIDVACVVMAALGARGALHLRAGRATAARLEALAGGLEAAQALTGAWLVINDRVDLALACRARGSAHEPIAARRRRAASGACPRTRRERALRRRGARRRAGGCDVARGRSRVRVRDAPWGERARDRLPAHARRRDRRAGDRHRRSEAGALRGTAPGRRARRRRDQGNLGRRECRTRRERLSFGV